MALLQRQPHVTGRPARPTANKLVVVSRLTVKRTNKRSLAKVKDAEQDVLSALSSIRGRGKTGLAEDQLERLNQAVEILEQDGGVSDPTTLDQIDGRWKLLYTSRPGTASPIQRTFVGVEAFKVYQEVQLLEQEPRVNNVVEFGSNIGYLKVEAQASTATKPLEGFTPRQGAGLPLLGKSFNYPPARPNSRIDFAFDQAAFYFKFLPIKLPYPVPFRLLGDERKGWIDTTYMNPEGTFRLARGNKGTLFVLIKDIPVKAQLLAAIQEQDNDKVLNLLSLLEQGENPTPNPAESDCISGTWRLIWSQQSENASPLQKWGTKQSRNYQIIDAKQGKLENVVNLGFGQVRAQARCEAISNERTDVAISGAIVKLGPVKLPLGIKGTGCVDWLYLDKTLRVTRGSKGSLFVHLREDDAQL